jgi:hypothetical protein
MGCTDIRFPTVLPAIAMGWRSEERSSLSSMLTPRALISARKLSSERYVK